MFTNTPSTRFQTNDKVWKLGGLATLFAGIVCISFNSITDHETLRRLAGEECSSYDNYCGNHEETEHIAALKEITNKTLIKFRALSREEKANLGEEGVINMFRDAVGPSFTDELKACTSKQCQDGISTGLLFLTTKMGEEISTEIQKASMSPEELAAQEEKELQERRKAITLGKTIKYFKYIDDKWCPGKITNIDQKNGKATVSIVLENVRTSVKYENIISTYFDQEYSYPHLTPEVDEKITIKHTFFIKDVDSDHKLPRHITCDAIVTSGYYGGGVSDPYALVRIPRIEDAIKMEIAELEKILDYSVDRRDRENKYIMNPHLLKQEINEERKRLQIID